MFDSVKLPPPRVGSTPLYKPYRYVPPQRVRLFGPFWSETGVDFAHFDLESSMVFSGTTNLVLRAFLLGKSPGDEVVELQDCTNVFIGSIPNE